MKPSTVFSTIRNKLLTVNADEVIQKARSHGMEVASLEDFRGKDVPYDEIESVMDDYRSSFARKSAIGGLTAGIGGFTTSVTFATMDTASLAIQLFRLSERFAILNGFDGEKPLHRDEMLNIYFASLGINGIAQTTLKYRLLKAGALAGTREASESLLLKGIIRFGKLIGKNVSSRQVGRLIPIVGGLAGATLNYSFARQSSKMMKKAYTRAYSKAWK